jgi:hypothetical protein
MVTQTQSNLKPSAVNPSSLPTGLISGDYSKPIPKSKTPRHAYLDSGTTTEHFRVKKKRRRISETLEIKRKTKRRLVECLGELKQDNYADSMDKCGRRKKMVMCGAHIVSKIPFHRCNIRFCPMCGGRRAARYVKKYLLYVVAFIASNSALKPCLLTLTQRKIKGESKKAARARILNSFKKLIRRNFFAEYFAGGIWACEITESETGNHSHLHIFIFRRKFIDAKLLKSEWAKVSPGAKNLNIKLIDDLQNGLSETIKYISKPIPAENLTLESVSQILELKGLRMIDTFGEFRTFCRENNIDDGETFDAEALEPGAEHVFVVGECCPHEGCEKPLYECVMTDIEEIEFYRRRERLTENQIRDKMELKL